MEAAWVAAIGSVLGAVCIGGGFFFTCCQMQKDSSVVEARYVLDVDASFAQYRLITTGSTNIEEALTVPRVPSWKPRDGEKTHFTSYMGLFERVETMVKHHIYLKEYFESFLLWKFHALFVNKHVQIQLCDCPDGWSKFINLAKMFRQELNKQDQRVAHKRFRHAYCKFEAVPELAISVKDFIDVLVEQVGNTSSSNILAALRLKARDNHLHWFGKRVKVWWESGRAYGGAVVEYKDGMHTVLYDDNDDEQLKLEGETPTKRWEAETPTNSCAAPQPEQANHGGLTRASSA